VAQLQALRQSVSPRISIAGRKGLLYLRQGRTMILIGKRQIGLEGSLVAPVTLVGRIYSVQCLLYVAGLKDFLQQKLRQIVGLLGYVDAELEMLWIHPPDAQVRDITHRTHRKRSIIMRDCGWIARRILKRVQTLGQRDASYSSGLSPFVRLASIAVMMACAWLDACPSRTHTGA
jgi:hypothetical protein